MLCGESKMVPSNEEADRTLLHSALSIFNPFTDPRCRRNKHLQTDQYKDCNSIK